MKHHVFQVGDKELKCRITTQGIINLEKKMGNKNVLKVFMEEEIPSFDITLLILHASLQKLEHGYTLEKVYALYDEYVEEGKAYTDLVKEVFNILEVSGFFKRPQKAEGQKETEIENLI